MNIIRIFFEFLPLLLILGLFVLWVRLIVRANRRSAAARRFQALPSAQEREDVEDDRENRPWVSYGTPGPGRFFGDDP